MININYWIFRVKNKHHPDCKIKSPEYAIFSNKVYYGWSHLDLRNENVFDEIKKYDREHKKRQFGIATKFAQITMGDIIVMPINKNTIVIGEINSSQQYEKSPVDYCCSLDKHDASNYYEIKWLTDKIAQNEFSQDLSHHIRYRRDSVSCLNENFIDEIDSIIKNA